MSLKFAIFPFLGGHEWVTYFWQIWVTITHWNSVQPKALYSSSFPHKLRVFGVSFGWFWMVSELQILKIRINLIFRGKVEQKIVSNVAADNDFLKVNLYSGTIAIKLPQKYQYMH